MNNTVHTEVVVEDENIVIGEQRWYVSDMNVVLSVLEALGVDVEERCVESCD